MINKKLLNTIGSMDERHIRENEIAELVKLGNSGTAEKRKLKKLRIVLIAAAVTAALAMCVGFVKLGNPRYRFVQTSDGTGFYFNIELKNNIIIPDEYREEDKWCKPVIVEKLPTEMFKDFGVDLLINDNFSEELDFTPVEIRTADGNLIEMRDINHPEVEVMGNVVTFGYKLYNKNIDKIVTVGAEVFYNYYADGFGYGIDMGEYEYIKLKDGSDCYVDNYSAVFAHDGIKYGICFVEEVGFDTVKQVLRDFDVL